MEWNIARVTSHRQGLCRRI